MIIQFGFNAIQALNNFVKPPVHIIKPFVLSNNGQKEPDQDRQGHLNERLLDEARRVQLPS
jgi:hypothetical protein